MRVLFHSTARVRCGLMITLTAAMAIWGLSGCSTEENPTFLTTPSPSPTTCTVQTGNNQSAQVGTPVSVAPAVIIKDQSGNPSSGATVNFSVQTGGGSITGGTVVTGADGIATVGSWTLGPNPGENRLRATASAIPNSPVTFTATGTSGAPTNSIAISAGNNQAAPPETAVPIAPSVIIRNPAGNPVAGTTVTFSVTSGGGTITGATATSNAQGIAAVGSWTLGAALGANTLQAAAAGLTGSPVTFTATGTNDPLAKWTLMVYLAADNSLALAGLQDIDEMEAAGDDPNVKVVVEVEFSQSQLQQNNCDLACVNLPNWNTYRYLVNGDDKAQQGVNGPAVDIGQRNMADPNELRDFVTWAKQTHPAERYALVLWNHGGGYIGLIEDATQGGHDLMTMSQLRQALDGLGPIDLVDFDMCLMGAYETMVSMEGLASYVVFSEEVVPGAGNPYQEIVDGLQQNPTASTSAVANMFVDRFHTSYTGGRSSTTKSAYDMANFLDFDNSLEALADTLRSQMSTLSTAIGQSAAGAQKYSYKQLKDLADFLRLLKQNTTDGALHTQIDAVVAKATAGSFRVANLLQNGGGSGYGQGDIDVSGSTGIHILMPSGGTEDQLPAGGSGSFGAYQALYPNKAWTLFLADWLSGASTNPTEDQGGTGLEAFLVWGEDAVALGVDIDFLVLEPDGNIYAPYMGPVSPNGTFTEDSAVTGGNFEGYQMKNVVAQGDYFFFANLYSDPQDYWPQYDLAYRYGSSGEYQWLFDPNYPFLSLDASWLDDPTPTWEELEAGDYSDLQIITSFTVGGGKGKAAPSPETLAGNQGDRSRPRLNDVQIETLRQYIRSKPHRTAWQSGQTSAPAMIDFAPGGKR